MENKRKIFLTFGVTKSPECYAAEEAVKQKKQKNKKNEEALITIGSEIKKLEQDIKGRFKTKGPAVDQKDCNKECAKAQENCISCKGKCNETRNNCKKKCKNKTCKEQCDRTHNACVANCGDCEKVKENCVRICTNKNTIANFNNIQKTIKESLDPTNEEIVKIEFDLILLNALQEKNPTTKREKEIEDKKIEKEELNVAFDKKLKDFKKVCFNQPSPFEEPDVVFQKIKDLQAKRRTGKVTLLELGQGKKDLKDLEERKKKICGN